MRRLAYLPAAERDLRAIAAWVVAQNGGRGAALRLVTRLRGQCAHLAAQ